MVLTFQFHYMYAWSITYLWWRTKVIAVRYCTFAVSIKLYCGSSLSDSSISCYGFN